MAASRKFLSESTHPEIVEGPAIMVTPVHGFTSSHDRPFGRNTGNGFFNFELQIPAPTPRIIKLRRESVNLSRPLVRDEKPYGTVVSFSNPSLSTLDWLIDFPSPFPYHLF